MITKPEAVKLVKEFLEGDLKKEEWFKDVQDYIKAVILYGSVSKGTNRLDSDVDVMIVIPLEIEERYTKGEYVYTYKNFEMNIVCRSIERLRTLAASEEKDLFQREVFRDSEIIWERDDEVGALLNAI
jgi:predicted nucleotidyltransferase